MTKKKKRILIVFLTAVFLFTASLGVYLGILCYRENQRRNIVYTFDEITQDKAKDVDYILSKYHITDEKKQKFYESVESQVYKEYHGKTGETSCDVYYFYDESDNFLFRITDWHSGVISISFVDNQYGHYYICSDYWEEE